MSKPIIGILGARMINDAGPVPVQADYVNRAYCAAVEKGGGIPLLIPIPSFPEAMESEDGQFLLVQWHPEELLESEPRMLALFTDLARRAQAADSPAAQDAGSPKPAAAGLQPDKGGGTAI